MKQKKIAIIMAGILAAAAAMTGCAEQNKTGSGHYDRSLSF